MIELEKDLVMEAIKNNAFYLAFASEEIRSEKDVVIAAINSDIGEIKSYGNIIYPISKTLQFASEELRNDNEVVMAAINKNGLALEFASDKLKADKEIVLAAISNNGAALDMLLELKMIKNC